MRNLVNLGKGLRHPRWPFVLDWAHPLAQGMVGCFVYRNGCFIDLTNNTRSCLVDNSSGDISRSAMPITGWPAAQYTGDATNDRYDLGPITSDNPLSLAGRDAFTLLAWCHFIQQDSSFPRIIDKSDGGNAANGWGMWSNASEQIVVGIDGQTSSSTANDAVVYGETNLYSASLTGLGATASGDFYRNGEFLRADPGAGYNQPVSTTTNAAIGNWNHATDRMIDGYISHVFVLNRDATHDQHMAFFDPASRFAFIQEFGRTAYFIPDGVGNIFNVSSTEALAFTDTATETADFVETITEALSLIDTSSETGNFGLSVAESLVLADASAIATKTLNFSVADALTLVDTASGILAGFEKTVTDALSLVDTATAQRIVNQVVTEAVSLTDSAAISTKILNLVVSEILHFGDVASADGGVPVQPDTKGGGSMTLARMRRLERLQLIRRDDEEILALLERFLR